MNTKLFLPFVVVILLVSSCKSKEIDKNATIEVLDQFEELQAIIDAQGNDVLVLNFWSTYCPPCIKELPHFKRLESEYQDKKIRVLLISLDDVKQLDSRVYPFVKKNKIKQEIMVLKDQNYSKWTDDIDESCYGALPATLIIKGKKRHFRFGSYETYDDLKADVDKMLEE
ncbi:TlpA disulfide reductase family protein [Yeosuana marina]|uniref:TlpA disulfide reductase family protein n=1 Tax=Yeosuana marina TaxID=1565536 RepID=UPI0030EDC8B7|tara:strand:+ start:523 stop:1032 length:510 start_codon:yes stop_codon:yes gene_type:complete